MQNIKKILLWIVMLVLFAQNGFSSITFAETFPAVSDDMWDEDDGKCRVCTMPSLEFQTYVNFQVELLQILQNALKEKEEDNKSKKVWLFSAGILKIPENLIKSWTNMFKKSGKELIDWYRSLKMWSIMLWSITTELVWKDSVWWLQILFRNEQFVREWSTLQDLDMSIHDAMRDLWMEWIWDEKMSNDIRVEITSLKMKYKSNDGNKLGLFDSFGVSPDTKYKDFAGMMLKLNAVMKTFISTHSKVVTSNFFKSFLWRIDNDISKWGISLKFNMDLMENMFASYKCAEWFSSCSSMWKDFSNNTKVRKQISQWFEKSMNTINTANDELLGSMLWIWSSIKDVFDGEWNTESWLTKKQLTLLRTVYGIDTTKLSKEQGIGLWSLLHWNAGKNIANSADLKSLDYFSADSKEKKEEAKKMAEREKQDDRYLRSLSAEAASWAMAEWEMAAEDRKDAAIYSWNQLKDNLLNTLNVVLIQKQEDKKVFLIYSNLEITRYFVEIGSLIHSIVENEIGTKDSKWLIKSLWEACEYQCSNKGTSNCYAK